MPGETMKKRLLHRWDHDGSEKEHEMSNVWWYDDFNEKPGYEHRSCTYDDQESKCCCRKPCCFIARKIRNPKRENLYHWSRAINHARNEVFDQQGLANAFYAAWGDCLNDRLYDGSRGPVFWWKCDSCAFRWQKTQFRFLLCCPHCKTAEAIGYEGKGARMSNGALADDNKRRVDYRKRHDDYYKRGVGTDPMVVAR